MYESVYDSLHENSAALGTVPATMSKELIINIKSNQIHCLMSFGKRLSEIGYLAM